MMIQFRQTAINHLRSNGCNKFRFAGKQLKRLVTDTFKKYSGIGSLLPAMGYGKKQIKDLEATINKTDCDLVIIGTPIDLRKLVKIDKPALRVTYELQEIGKPDLMDVLKKFI